MLNCIVIGDGRVGNIHIKNLNNNKNFLILKIYNIYNIQEIKIDLKKNNIDAVFICSPTNTHYNYIKLCLINKIHVFVEKSISINKLEIIECFKLADDYNLVLFVGFNRRFDSNIENIKLQIKNNEIGKINQILSISRDYLIPTKEYIKSSNGIFHDCAVHNIDYINWFLEDIPISVYCTGIYNQKLNDYDHVNILLEYSNDIIANIILSRISSNYDERCEIYGEKGEILKNKFITNNKKSFPEIYLESYIKEVNYFYECIIENKKSNISLEDNLAVDLIAKYCEKSINEKKKITIKYDINEYRNYTNVNNGVKNNYKKARINQTVSYVKNMHEKYCKFTIKMNIWNIIEKLNNFVDLSDPDISLPNSYHGYQTAEAIRNDKYPDWLQLIGLIHDLGKIIYLKGCDQDGTTLKEQWGIVGDTFIVGCKIPSDIIFPEFNKLNKDINNNSYNTKNGIYDQQCGLENTLCSWGHDEYLYNILKFNKTKFPDEALYIIRYHSLYLHHKNNTYSNLMNNTDHKSLKWLKIFNKYDLYSKSDKLINIQEIKSYYQNLIDKYFLNNYLFI